LTVKYRDLNSQKLFQDQKRYHLLQFPI